MEPNELLITSFKEIIPYIKLRLITKVREDKGKLVLELDNGTILTIFDLEIEYNEP